MKKLLLAVKMEILVSYTRKIVGVPEKYEGVFENNYLIQSLKQVDFKFLDRRNKRIKIFP